RVVYGGGGGLPAVPSDHDGGAFALCLQPRRLFFAPNRASLRGAGGFHGGHGDEPAGFPHHRQAPSAPFEGAERLVRAGAQAVPSGGGLAKLGHVALDGTKVQANASVHKAMSYGRMLETEKRLKAEVSAWFARAEATDAEEDRAHGSDRRGDEMPDWVANKTARLER